MFIKDEEAHGAYGTIGNVDMEKHTAFVSLSVSSIRTVMQDHH